MKLFLQIFHFLISISLITVILLQIPEGGLGVILGGGGEIYHTKRGLERGLFFLTILLALLFTTSALVNFFLG